jgi:predicted phosphodiesterase
VGPGNALHHSFLLRGCFYGSCLIASMHCSVNGVILRILIIATFFAVIRPAATYLSEKINPKISQRISRLQSSFTNLPPSTLIIVDGDNVRGKTKFSASKEQLCKDLDAFVACSGIDGRVVLMYDHGNEHEAFLFGSLAVCFSGPGRTADDVIARDLVWFQRRFDCSVVVVTADTGLKTRCFQGGRITGQDVTIVDSTLFVELLGSTIASISENSTTPSSYSNISNMGVPENEVTPQAILSVEAMRPFTADRMNVLRRELGVRNQIRSIEKFVKGGCGKKKMVKLQKRAAELDKRLKKVISDESISLGATLDEAMKMSPEFQEAGYNALVGMLRAGSTRGREETWERVLLAERFRNTLLAKQISSSYEADAPVGSTNTTSISTTEEIDSSEVTDHQATTILSLVKPLETYVTEINVNYSKTNTTLELLRWVQRKESSESPGSVVESADGVASIAPDGTVTSMVPVEVIDSEVVMNSVFLIIEVPAPRKEELEDRGERMLSPIHEQILIQQKRLQNEKELEAIRREQMTEEERSAPVRTAKALLMSAKSLAGPRISNNVPYSVTAEGSRIYNIETLSRTSQSKKIRSDKTITTKSEPNTVEADDVIDLEDPSLSVRIVCVSDTHGMESVLSGSVPAGDVFIHAGDFAADKGKSRLKLKQLDEWMATLPHELKIVVRGNHDPSGGCFPLSKAIYAERATTVMFRGVAIGLAPHGTINVPSASIVVSHEPPYGVLDQALGKKKPHVGSHYLQKSAMRLVSKPQLWIFGHIHEGFGAIRTTFGSKGLTTHPKGSPVYSSTLCVNAANANPGPAHSIDNLPICIDIRRISDAKEKIENGEEMIDIAMKP